MKLHPKIRIPVPTRFNPNIDYSKFGTPVISYILFTLNTIGNGPELRGFYECECGMLGCESFDLSYGEIPENLIDFMKQHVQLRHTK